MARTVQEGGREVDLRQLFLVSLYVCREAGYPVDHDPEYESAVNLAVLKASRSYHRLADAGNPLSYAAMLALRACRKVDAMLAAWRRQDEAGAARGQAQATPISLPLTDYELLSFVACHGRQRAARLLFMSPDKLRDRLDEVAFRIGRELAP